MKGLTHFMTGVAVATFFPLAMLAAYNKGNIYWSLLIPIGGLFGYLPDFLDFKLSRYLEEEHYKINPGYTELDPWKVANQVVQAINEAYTTNRPVNIKLQTIRMPNGLWRRYSILFRLKEREVVVQIGPLITTGLEVLHGTEPDPPKIAVVKYEPNLYYSYEDVTNVDIWDGPTFQFRREGDTVYADFIQWHRRWSHSLTLGLLLGFSFAGLFGLIQWLRGATVSDYEILTIWGVIVGGVWGHVLVDQLGWLGSNLWWPITGKRKTGLGLTRSMDPLANFTTTYILTMLILWNMNRFAPDPIFQWTDLQFFIGYIIVPLAVIFAIAMTLRKRSMKAKMTRNQEELTEISMEVAEF